MKTAFLSLLACLIALSLPAQDLIYLQDGTEIKAKVDEVGLETISFRYFQDQSGPSFELKKTELSRIVYENGYEESYEAASSPPAVVASEAEPAAAPAPRSDLIRLRSGEELVGKVEEIGEDYVRYVPEGKSGAETLVKAEVASITYPSGFVDEFAAAPTPPPAPPVDFPAPAGPVVLSEVDIDEPVPAPEAQPDTAVSAAAPAEAWGQQRLQLGPLEAYVLLYAGGGAGQLLGGPGLESLTAQADSLSLNNSEAFTYSAGSHWRGGFQLGATLGLQLSQQLAVEAGLQYLQQDYAVFLRRAYADPAFRYDSQLDSSVFYRRRALAVPLGVTVSLSPVLAVTAGLQISTTTQAAATEEIRFEEYINQEPASNPEGVQRRSLPDPDLPSLGLAGQAGLRLGRTDGLMFQLSATYQPGAVSLADGKAAWLGLHGHLIFAF